jgi:hypothetical protein
MIKKTSILASWAIVLGSIVATPLATNAAWGFMNQRGTQIWVAGAQVGWQWNEWFLSFVQNAVNWILWLLGLITIIILIYGGFLMVTAAWDDGKYKKWFSIVKQAVIGLIVIGVSALVVNLIFSFVNTNTQNTENTPTG